jgi:hypothetical protein
MSLFDIDKEIVNYLEQNLYSGVYTLFVDGKIQQKGQSFSYVRKGISKHEGSLVFFEYIKQSGHQIEYSNPSILPSIAAKARKTNLFSYNFSRWLEKNYHRNFLGIKINEQVKAVFIESPMYKIFRNKITTLSSLQIEFGPESDEVGALQPSHLLELVSRFRIDAFVNISRLDNSPFKRQLARELPVFYRSLEFCTAFWSVDGLYNPWEEDVLLKNILGDTEIYWLIQKKKITARKSQMRYSVISNKQISAALGLSKVVPFYYTFFTEFILGLVGLTSYLPPTIPAKELVVYRLGFKIPDLPKVTNLEGLRKLTPQEQGFYMESKGLSAYVITHLTDFETRGFRDNIDLRDVLQEAQLLNFSEDIGRDRNELLPATFM